ncbi:MAG: hypothetical protein LBD88_05085 [Candidatus Peribacteria bacterium]|jgi:hypothetical protein|nr:hypothetical protein [Candidatus Peribacteria bacterium]
MNFQKILQKPVNKPTSTKEQNTKVEDLFATSSEKNQNNAINSDLNIGAY